MIELMKSRVVLKSVLFVLCLCVCFSINIVSQHAYAETADEENDFEEKTFEAKELYTVDRPNDIETYSNQGTGQIITQTITDCGISKTAYVEFSIPERGWVWIDSTANSDYPGHGNGITLYNNNALTRMIRSNYAPVNNMSERLYAYYLEAGTYYLEIYLSKYFANNDPKELKQIVYGYFMPSSNVLSAQVQQEDNGETATISCSSKMSNAVYNWANDESVIHVINDTENFYNNISVVNSFEVSKNGIYSIRSSSEMSEWKNYPVDMHITVSGLSDANTNSDITDSFKPSEKIFSEDECNLCQINSPNEVESGVNCGNGELVRQCLLDTGKEKNAYVEIKIPERGWAWIDVTANTDYPGHASNITLYSNSALTKEVQSKYTQYNSVSEGRKAYYLEAGTYYLQVYLKKYFANNSPSELRQVVSGFYLPVSKVMSVDTVKKDNKATFKCSSGISSVIYYWAKDVSTVDHINDNYNFYVNQSDTNEIVVSENGDYSVKVTSELYEWTHYPFDVHVAVSGLTENDLGSNDDSSKDSTENKDDGINNNESGNSNGSASNNSSDDKSGESSSNSNSNSSNSSNSNSSSSNSSNSNSSSSNSSNSNSSSSNSSSSNNYSDNSFDYGTTLKTPKKVTIYSAKNQKGRKIYLYWKWQYSTQATGYQVQYALNKNFTKSKKTKKINDNIIDTVTLKKLKKKTYYIRIRAVNKSGSKVKYGAWSKVKKVKVKK